MVVTWQAVKIVVTIYFNTPDDGLCSKRGVAARKAKAVKVH